MTINLASGDWVPDSCTLPTAQQPIRVAEFDQFLASAVQRIERPTPTRLDLKLEPGSETIGRGLAARETQCCSFFTFTFEPVTGGSLMHIDVPLAHVEVLDALQNQAGTAAGHSS
ncbi:hypothetical protein [Nocardia sp. NBC_01388]|uniref:hypothetical protein n=1 Tax=Nocardia sp. NBC_01388 TaxID=2903596 RepID=UPI0032548FB2